MPKIYLRKKRAKLWDDGDFACRTKADEECYFKGAECPEKYFDICRKGYIFIKVNRPDGTE